MWTERDEMNDDPLIHAMHIILRYNDAVSRSIRDFTTSATNDIEEAITILKNNITGNTQSNRVQHYKSVNPELTVHDIYTKNVKLNEIERVSWTKFRLSAHSLEIEKGRWNRRGRGRLDVEERLCSCGQIQTEVHVVENCPVSSHLRQIYNVTTLTDLMVSRTDYDLVCTIIHKLLSLY